MQTKYVYLVQFEHVQPQLLDSLHDTTAFAIVLIFTARINLNTFPFGSCVCARVCVCVCKCGGAGKQMQKYFIFAFS